MPGRHRGSADPGSPADLDLICLWAERLLGLEAQRTAQAVAIVRSWKLPDLERLLLETPDLDCIAALMLLSESIETLVAQGIPRTKLLKKVRDAAAPDRFWPTWTEIRAAGILAECDLGLTVEMEPERSAGAHADLRLIDEEGTEGDLEFKTVGLSEHDRRWLIQAGTMLNRLVPPLGLVTLHAEAGSQLRVREETRARSWVGARETAEELARQSFSSAKWWSQLSGITIVGRYGEAAYVRRVSGRLKTAVKRQLNTDRPAALGIWWNNGAPFQALRAALAASELPENVETLIVLGQSLAVPMNWIDVFVAPMEIRTPYGEPTLRSTGHVELAQRALERFESSSGLRAALLIDPETGRELLRRDGSRTVDPFNLLFDADPRKLTSPLRSPSPIQDVRLRN